MQILAVRKVKSLLNFALISKNQKGIKFESLQSVGVCDVDDLQKHLSIEAELVVGLPGDQIFIRQLKIPVRNRAALAKALPYQLESLIPFASNPEAQVVVTRRKEAKGYQVTPFAFLSRHLTECVEEYEPLGIDPEWVGCIPQALKRFTKHFAPDIDSAIVCCADGTSTHIISMIRGDIDVSLTLHKGGDERTSQEIKRSIAYCLQRDEAGEIKGVLQLGSQAFQESFLGIESIAIRNETLFDDVKLKSFAIEIGLGLDVAKGDSETVQLRRGAALSESHFTKGKRGALALFGSALVAIVILCGISYSMLNVKKEALKRRIECVVEREIEPFSTSYEWIDVLDKERAAFKKRGASIGFHKWPVGVSQLLGWLSGHPDLQEGVEIERLDYFLQRYPTLGAPLDRFKVKIDLTFSASSPLVARDFHQALINNEEKYIDAKEAIHWERGESAYRAVFYLKNPF